MCRGLTIIMGVFVIMMMLSGCGSEPRASISGVVKFDNQPITYGTITFLSDKKKHEATNVIIFEGKYTISDFTTGPCKIGVTSLEPPTAEDLKPNPASPHSENEKSTPPPKGPFVKIPDKYSEPYRSGLTYEVKPGKQEYDLKLLP